MKTCALLLSLLLTLAGRPAWAQTEEALAPDRLREIDARIEALDARRAEISTEGPMAATLFGVGAMLVGGIMLGVGIGSCSDEYDYECGGAGSGIGVAGAGAGLIAVGGATAIIGGVTWQTRARRRNEVDAERESLIKERAGLADALSRLEVGGAYRDGTRFVTLGFRF